MTVQGTEPGFELNTKFSYSIVLAIMEFKLFLVLTEFALYD